MVSVFYFTPLPGFFSPFPLGTCSLSVTREYLALRDGPRRFRQDFSCPAVLRIPYRVHSISFTGLSPSLVCLSILIQLYRKFITLNVRSYNPNPKIGLGSSAFARHYLRNRFFFLFLRLLRCFSSPGCFHITMYSLYDTYALP